MPWLDISLPIAVFSDERGLQLGVFGRWLGESRLEWIDRVTKWCETLIKTHLMPGEIRHLHSEREEHK